jgi:hypothetical protein
MTPFVGNYTPEELEQGRKDLAATSPQQIETLYRTGKIGLTEKIEMLRSYGQMKREIRIRDMSAAGTGGAMGEIKNYALGVLKEGEKAWLAASKLFASEPPAPAPQGRQVTVNGKPLPIDTPKTPKSKGALAGEAVFHSLMTGLEALKAYDIPGNIVERWALEAGVEPGYARAANWATWIPSNFLGIKATLSPVFKVAGKAINTERKLLKGANLAADNYIKFLRDPVGEATKSAMKLDAGETAKVLGSLDDAIMHTETGQALKTVADAVTSVEQSMGVQTAKAAEPAAAAGWEGLEAVDEVFPTPDALENGSMSMLIKFYEQKAQRYVRKGIAHEVTEAQAARMSFQDLLSRPPEQAMSAAELAYVGRINDTIRQGLENTLNDALPFVDDIAAGKRPDLVGLFKAHFQAFAQTNPVFLGASGEVGRGLEFMKVLQPEVQAARIYDTMLKGLGSDMLAESGDAAVAKALLKLSVLEKDARQTFLTESAKSDSPSVWHSLFKSMLFVMPRTHFANFAGQNQGAVLEMMQYTGAALSRAEDAPSLQSAYALWKGFGSAWLHLPRISRMAWERSALPLEKLGLEGATDAVSRYGPLRAMGFTDELVGAALENGFVNAYAIERGLANGLNGRALADFANKLKSNAASLQELMDQAAPRVQHAMFHDQLSPAGEAIANAIRTSKADFWLPVVKFPINSLKAARDWTPGLQFFSHKMIDDIAAGGAREAEARSRVTISWMFSNYLWGEAKVGNITGGGPLDPEKKRAWEAAGNKPYSFHGVPYRWFEPLGTVVGAVADAATFANQMDPDDLEDFAGGLNVTLSRMIENNWWLRSMEGVTGLVSGMKDAKKTEDFFREFGKVVAAPAITIGSGGPAGGTLREFLDPEVKQIRSLTDYYLSKVPGASRTVPPRLNYSGEVQTIPPVLGHRWLGIVLPSGLRTTGTPDPVGAFLHKHGLQLQDNWKSFGGADDERPFWEPGQGRLSPALDVNQSHDWKMLALTDARDYTGLTWTEKIAELEADPEFQAKGRYDKQKAVTRAYNRYRRLGREMLANSNPEVAFKLDLARQKTRQMRGDGMLADDVPDEDVPAEDLGEAPMPEQQQPMQSAVEPVEPTGAEAPVQ